MTLVAPQLGDLEASAEVTVDQALSLRRDLHRARARLVQRNRGTGCDRNDVRAVESIEREWLALREELRDDVDVAFRTEHPCPLLAECPWGEP